VSLAGNVLLWWTAGETDWCGEPEDRFVKPVTVSKHSHMSLITWQFNQMEWKLSVSNLLLDKLFEFHFLACYPFLPSDAQLSTSRFKTILCQQITQHLYSSLSSLFILPSTISHRRTSTLAKSISKQIHLPYKLEDVSGVSSITSAPCDGFKLFDKPLTSDRHHRMLTIMKSTSFIRLNHKTKKMNFRQGSPIWLLVRLQV